jgi:hypothetical protein
MSKYVSLVMISVVTALCSGCSTVQYGSIRRSDCATKAECHRIAAAACPRGYRVESLQFGNREEEFNTDDTSPDEFSGRILGSLVGAAATAVFDDTPWNIEYLCTID